MNFTDFFSNESYKKQTELCVIMNKNGSDKGSGHHNYTTFYDYIFFKIKDEVKNVFELGLGTNNMVFDSHMSGQGVPCGSLRGWREYFKNSNIFGADIDRDILYQEERIKTFYCDQLNQETIIQMWDKIDIKFDIIIEDGLHKYYANKIFFENSIQMLNKGGYYIIEDIHHDEFIKFEELIKNESYKFEIMEIVKIPNPKNLSDNNLLVIKK